MSNTRDAENAKYNAIIALENNLHGKAWLVFKVLAIITAFAVATIFVVFCYAGCFYAAEGSTAERVVIFIIASIVLLIELWGLYHFGVSALARIIFYFKNR